MYNLFIRRRRYRHHTHSFAFFMLGQRPLSFKVFRCYKKAPFYELFSFRTGYLMSSPKRPASTSRTNTLSSNRKRPICARPGPFAVNVKAGEDYIWCSCGRSKGQPWCDGSHIGTGLEPIPFTAPITGEFYMCGCKRSENKPYCFGNCTGNNKPQKKYQI